MVAITKEKAKEKIRELVDDFLSVPKEKLDEKSEFQIQTEYIDPLFEALGWDMKKDAEREKRIFKGRADYTLKIGNQEKLIIEAKKEADEIKIRAKKQVEEERDKLNQAVKDKMVDLSIAIVDKAFKDFLDGETKKKITQHILNNFGKKVVYEN